MSDVQRFYDNLADSYHFILHDWEKWVESQGDILSNFLAMLDFAPSKTLLDCTCGIGTQAIALATKGYQVHATDLSPRAIERAIKYAEKFSVAESMTFAVADLLKPPTHPQTYSIVISCDNAIAHFHDEKDLSQAIDTMLMQLESAGLLLISLRDYDQEVKNPRQHTPVHVNDTDEGRRIVFQVWDWSEDKTSYHFQMFIIRQNGDEWITEMHPTHLRTWQRADITRLLEMKNLQDIQWHMPDESGFYQPIVTAKKA